MRNYLTPGARLSDLHHITACAPRMRQLAAGLEVLENLADDGETTERTATRVARRIQRLSNTIENYVEENPEFLGSMCRLTDMGAGVVVEADDQKLWESLDADDGYTTTDQNGFVHIEPEDAHGCFSTGRQLILGKLHHV